jgi:hypothetical protein
MPQKLIAYQYPARSSQQEIKHAPTLMLQISMIEIVGYFGNVFATTANKTSRL